VFLAGIEREGVGEREFPVAGKQSRRDVENRRFSKAKRVRPPRGGTK
jgi:hypothetical protein